MNKENIQFNITSSVRTFNPNWATTSNSICVAGCDLMLECGLLNNICAISKPIINRCQPPNVYIGVMVLISTEENRKIKWFDLSDLNPLVVL